MTDYYLLGVLCGVLIAVLAAVLVYFVRKRSGTRKRGQYDERQQRARGIAYRNGFWTVIGCLFVWCCLLAEAVPAAVKLPVLQMLCVTLMAGVAVFAVSCIMLDAYIRIQENPRTVALFVAFVMVINLLCAATNASVNGEHGLWWMNLSFGIVAAVMLAALGIKAVMRKREDEE